MYVSVVMLDSAFSCNTSPNPLACIIGNYLILSSVRRVCVGVCLSICLSYVLESLRYNSGTLVLTDLLLPHVKWARDHCMVRPEVADDGGGQ
jgi:hypothetical protein